MFSKLASLAPTRAMERCSNARMPNPPLTAHRSPLTAASVKSSRSSLFKDGHHRFRTNTIAVTLNGGTAMRMRLVVPIAALIVVGSTAVAHAETGVETMSLEDAIKFHHSGEIDKDSGDKRAHAEKLVKQDIRACLSFYNPDQCTGSAKEWVEQWDALELPSSSAESSTSALSSSSPWKSLLQLHAPFTKSAVDYFVAMPSPSVAMIR